MARNESRPLYGENGQILDGLKDGGSHCFGFFFGRGGHDHHDQISIFTGEEFVANGLVVGVLVDGLIDGGGQCVFAVFDVPDHRTGELKRDGRLAVFISDTGNVALLFAVVFDTDGLGGAVGLASRILTDCLNQCFQCVGEKNFETHVRSLKHLKRNCKSIIGGK